MMENVAFKLIGRKAHRLQAFTNIPSEQQSLRDIVSDSLERIGYIEDAKNVFESERVRRHLEGTMQLIIKAFGLIIQHISTPPLRKPISSLKGCQVA